MEAGFNAFGQARREGNEEGKLTVNQAALSDGKAAPLGLGHPANDADQGDRE
ncbi:TRAP-type transport system, small permease component, predicted N-acetylneuraminate transporter [Qipengyuania citrea LAMA 915]|uniref:TRAP-type transport system, small permease component, predicted N-acetylneuraminate transporter n=1 Tax=Qipengyuania citrea LAMA 915 TaxID=1306953 RepID=A0A0L1K9Q1_9SPHN|nr:TRAP-type transport system, small permease component, predicted N-acetylneuraminate transporter [Qipengyuania citrea LAMA 915]